MKVKKILSCFLVASMMFSTISFSALADGTTPPERSITLNADRSEVSTDETFTIAVEVSGVEALGARWQLDYDETYFEYVSADFGTATNQKTDDVLNPDVMSVTGVLSTTVATYTFKAKNQKTNGGDEETFTLSGVDVRTVEDVWLGTDVSDYISVDNTRVAIVLRTIEGVTVNFGDEESTHDITHDYDAQSHTVSVTSDTSDVNITYTCDGETQNEPFAFENAGEYVITYTITKDGYEPETGEITLVINKADFSDVVEKFDETTIENGVYDYTFDGQPHTFGIGSVDCVGDPEITYTYKVNGVALNDGETNPTMLDAKEYVIDYTISAANHNDYFGKTTITIVQARIADITIEYDDYDITDELNDNNSTYGVTYDGLQHYVNIASVVLVGDEEYSVSYSYSYDDSAFTEFGAAPVIDKAGEYVVRYKVEATNHETADGEFTIVVKTADFPRVPVNFGETDITEDIKDDNAYPFSYDGNTYEFTVGSVETVDGANVDITYSWKYNDGEVQNGVPSIKAAGTYEITYTVTAENHTPFENIITITVGEPIYVVEVQFGAHSDYVEGKKLILVYTHANDVSFNYDGNQMLDVSEKKYKYKDTETYDKVYAWIGDAFMETGTTEEEKLAPYEALVSVDYDNTPADDIDYTNPLDINGVNEADDSAVGWNDIMAGYSTLEQNPYTFANQIKGAIKTDVDGNKRAHSDDLVDIIEMVYPSVN